ncbi:MAG: hypothetical protein H6807_11210 [Planctomycetes bacterium]|nr:hypothetical protein [Planctomycetota bacterium]
MDWETLNELSRKIPAPAVAAIVVHLVLARQRKKATREAARRREEQERFQLALVNDPELRALVNREVDQIEARKQAVELPEPIVEADIRAWVAGLFRPDGEFEDFWRLERLGQPALPVLVEALQRKDVRRPFADEELPAVYWSRTPCDRILALLAALDPGPELPALLRLARGASLIGRLQLMALLATSGRDEVVDFVIETARSGVRNQVIGGLLDGLESPGTADRIEPGFRRAVFDLIAEGLDGSRPTLDLAELASGLFRLDRGRAEGLLLGPGFAERPGPGRAAILDGMQAAGCRCDRDFLLGLIGDMDLATLDDSRLGLVGAVMRQLVAIAGPGDRALLEAALESPAADLRRTAITGLERLAGREDPTQALFEMQARLGRDRMSDAAVALVCALGYEVGARTQGHRHYLAVTSPQDVDAAIVGLDRLGASGLAEVLVRARRIAAQLGPAATAGARLRLFRTLGSEAIEQLEQLDAEFAACGTDLDLAVRLHAHRQPADFEPST